MILLTFNKERFAEKLSLQCSQASTEPSLLYFVSTLDTLLAFWGAIRECEAAIPPLAFEERLGVSIETVRLWQETLGRIYDAADSARREPVAPWDPAAACMSELPFDSVNPQSFSNLQDTLGSNSLLLGASAQEIYTYGRMLEATLEEIEDWEYSTLMVFTPDEIRGLLQRIHSLELRP